MEEIEETARQLSAKIIASYALRSRPPLSQGDANTLHSWLTEKLRIALLIRLPEDEVCEWANNTLAEFERRVGRSPGPRVTSIDDQNREVRMAGA